MTSTDALHTNNHLTQDRWPVRTCAVSQVRSAWVLHSYGEDFAPEDLNLVRRRFPGRHVTLDGDVITVWPHPGTQR